MTARERQHRKNAKAKRRKVRTAKRALELVEKALGLE